MINIKLTRSGGQLGKKMQASRQVNMDEKILVTKLRAAAPVPNPYARDEFKYNLTINEKQVYPIDMSLLKGNIKKMVIEMEDDLKVGVD